MIYIDILLPFQTCNFYCLQEQNSTEARASQGYRAMHSHCRGAFSQHSSHQIAHPGDGNTVKPERPVTSSRQLQASPAFLQDCFSKQIILLIL